MGRQIAVAMNEADETLFLDYLRSVADIAIYRSWSPTESTVENFVQDDGASPFYIHNRAFPWQACFKRVDYEDRSTGTLGTYFRVVDRHAPLIEYMRCPLETSDPGSPGRLYWTKLFISQPHEIEYDLDAFDRWFSSVMRWVRKNGTKLQFAGRDTWCLPGARCVLETRA